MRIGMIAGGLLAAGLLATGCGGADATMDEPSNLATREDALPPCDGDRQYDHVTYSDATYTTVTGGWHCYCGEGSGWVYGNFAGPYYLEVETGTCM